MPILNASLGAGAQAMTNLLTRGPIIPIEVWVPSALESYLRSHNMGVPPPVSGFALIDTGATVSAVDDLAIRILGVSPVDVASVGTAGGPQRQYVYPARFLVANRTWVLEFTRVTGANLSDTGFIALIGRDFLSRALLVYNGLQGSFTVAL